MARSGALTPRSPVALAPCGVGSCGALRCSDLREARRMLEVVPIHPRARYIRPVSLVSRGIVQLTFTAKMLSTQARSAARRLSISAFDASNALRPRNARSLARISQRTPTWISSANTLRPAYAIRTYANGRPHPPGGTHQMNMGGGEEKPALEEYGVDLTKKAKDGKLDPVIGRDAEIHRTIQSI